MRGPQEDIAIIGEAGFWEGEDDPLLNAVALLIMYAKRRHKPVRNLHLLATAIEKGDGVAAQKFYDRLVAEVNSVLPKYPDIVATMELSAQMTPEQKAQIDQLMGDEATEAAGLDLDSITLRVGEHCEWIDVNQMVFRVVDFDRNGTTVDLDAGAQSVQARSATDPYGYLLVESPTVNRPVQLPIIHQDDFYLASTIFDDPGFSFPEGAELLVVYAPKKMNKQGFSTSPHHVLHYALVPEGTLERYYSDDETGNRRMSRPEPHLIFGSFRYDGMISVVTNYDPQL